MRYQKKYKFYEMLKLVIEEKRKFRLPSWDYKDCVWFEHTGFASNMIMTNESLRLRSNDIRGAIAIPYIPTKHDLVSTQWIEVE